MVRTGWVLAVLTLAALLRAAAPTPVPPIDDDDPFLCRSADQDLFGEALVHAIESDAVQRCFRDGGILLHARLRRCTSSTIETHVVDLTFWLGRAHHWNASHMRMLRVTSLEDRATGKSTWRLEASPDFIVRDGPMALPATCMAGTVDALHAMRAALTDTKIHGLLGELFPHYSVVSIEIPTGATFESDAAIPVTLRLRNRQRSADSLQVTVDVTREEVRAPAIKSVRTPSQGGAR